MKDWTPPPLPDNPAPPPLPETPVPPDVTTYVPPIEIPPVYDNIPEVFNEPGPYNTVNDSGIDVTTSVILAGVAATIVGVNNYWDPYGNNGYNPGPGPAPPPVVEIPVVTPPEPLPVYEQIFNFPVEPLPIFDEPVVVADQWSKGDDIRVYSQPVYVYGPEPPSSGVTTVSDLMNPGAYDNHTGPLPFF